ncbi:hypothetical protein L6R49_05505 [Myxococcota bacterium]|nr:hypothetical protein [Myxococcota bacterium]
MNSPLLPLMLLGAPRLAYAQDPPIAEGRCFVDLVDPASRGLFIADPDGLIPEHIEAELHLATVDLARAEGLSPRILTARSSPQDAEACAKELAARWSIPTSGVILLWLRSPPELALWVTRDDGVPLSLAEREGLKASITADGLDLRGERALVEALPRLAAARRAPLPEAAAPPPWSWSWLGLGAVLGALVGALAPRLRRPLV